MAGAPPPEVAEAIKAAEQMFLTEGLGRAMTPRVANRFFINREGDGALLMIGGVGAAFSGDPPAPFPVAQVTEVYRVPLDFLRALRAVVNDLLGDE